MNHPALLRRLSALALIAGWAVLAATGFWALLVGGGPLGGVPLLLHNTAAGAFLAGLAGCALLGPGERPGRHAPPLFWLVLAAGFASGATMLLAMFPVLGTQGLHTVVLLHTISGGAFSLLLAAYLILYWKRHAGNAPVPSSRREASL